jgi:hypothetical protein
MKKQKMCQLPGSNQGPLDLQSNALPAELSRHLLLLQRVSGFYSHVGPLPTLEDIIHSMSLKGKSSRRRIFIPFLCMMFSSSSQDVAVEPDLSDEDDRMIHGDSSDSEKGDRLGGEDSDAEFQVESEDEQEQEDVQRMIESVYKDMRMKKFGSMKSCPDPTVHLLSYTERKLRFLMELLAGIVDSPPLSRTFRLFPSTWESQLRQGSPIDTLQTREILEINVIGLKSVRWTVDQMLDKFVEWTLSAVRRSQGSDEKRAIDLKMKLHASENGMNGLKVKVAEMESVIEHQDIEMERLRLVREQKRRRIEEERAQLLQEVVQLRVKLSEKVDPSDLSVLQSFLTAGIMTGSDDEEEEDDDEYEGEEEYRDRVDDMEENDGSDDLGGRRRDYHDSHVGLPQRSAGGAMEGKGERKRSVAMKMKMMKKKKRAAMKSRAQSGVMNVLELKAVCVLSSDRKGKKKI